MQLSETQKKLEEQLLHTCVMHSGEYTPGHHGSGSWATTYSNQFILASSQLMMLYRAAGAYSYETELSKAFRQRSIRSCRGAEMTISRVRYLIQEHLYDKIAELDKNN